MSKAKKIGLGIGIAVIAFFIITLVITINYGSEEQTQMAKLRSFSEAELQTMVVVWEYGDILRNIEYYEGKIIHIEGSIITTEYVSGDRYGLLVGIDCKPRPDNLDCNDMVIGYNGKKLLKDDKIEAWIIVDKIAEVKTDSGEYELMPVVEAIKVNCLTCPE